MPGFIFDGWEARSIHFLVAMNSGAQTAVAILICAVQNVEFAGGCVADAKAGGILDNDPRVKQAAILYYADDQHEQNRQHQGKLKHALSFCPVQRPGGALAPYGRDQFHITASSRNKRNKKVPSLRG
jgi:hypothetical protein